MSKSQRLSWTTEKAAMFWVKCNKGVRPLPLLPQRGVTQAPSQQTLSPLPLITVLQPSPTTTSFGPPKQPVYAVHRLSLLLGLPAGEPLLCQRIQHIPVPLWSVAKFCIFGSRKAVKGSLSLDSCIQSSVSHYIPLLQEYG